MESLIWSCPHRHDHKLWSCRSWLLHWRVLYLPWNVISKCLKWRVYRGGHFFSGIMGLQSPSKLKALSGYTLSSVTPSGQYKYRKSPFFIFRWPLAIGLIKITAPSPYTVYPSRHPLQEAQWMWRVHFIITFFMRVYLFLRGGAFFFSFHVFESERKFEDNKML